MAKACITVNCDGELPSDSKHERCQLCRGSFYYWKKKRPAQVLDRRNRLAKYSDRMQVIIEERNIKDK